MLIKQLKDRTVITFNTMNDNDNGENCYTLEDVGVKVFLTKEEAAEKVKFMTSYHNGFNDGYNKAIDDIYAKSFKEYNEQIAYEEICSILKDKLMKLKKDEQSKWDECNVRKAFDDSEEKISCNCQHNSNPRDNELCRICDGKQTNADKIRNMSDEELASWYVIKCEIMMGTKCQKPFKTCKDCILDWLQSEAE